MLIPVEMAAGSRDQRQDVFGSAASGTVQWTGEVAAEKILLPLDADGGSAHTPWHPVRVPPVPAVVPCGPVCDWRSWPAGGRGCRGSQDGVAGSGRAVRGRRPAPPART